eukprot:TRINITY_DN1252_c0_g1_i5.p1 TRINITY_DN1252_c0_g1~~TRINITY_DN1252_c0_g1_i5.p1  ORF type:complete len:319 (+),score=38.85 TRINITY_DN1252_c0_g1_i5:125-1081(+)
MRTIAVLLFAALVGQAVCGLTASQHFGNFIATHNKKYTVAERAHRFDIFKKNLEIIAQLNAQSNLTEYGVNHFSDLTSEEFARLYLSKVHESPRDLETLDVAKLRDVLPDTWDWREHGAITVVKDQAQCGSCWAFSAAANMESVWFLAGHPLVSFAPQQLVDCDSTSDGCNGGLPLYADKYTINAGGIMLWEDYPYTAVDGKCAFNRTKAVGKFSSSKQLPKNDADLQTWMYKNGAASIGVYADTTWQHYKSGILPKPSSCLRFNHAVTVVGWGIDNDTNTPYWIVKNSWAEDWGEKGYIRLHRGDDCVSKDATTIVA